MAQVVSWDFAACGLWLPISLRNLEISSVVRPLCLLKDNSKVTVFFEIQILVAIITQWITGKIETSTESFCFQHYQIQYQLLFMIRIIWFDQLSSDRKESVKLTTSSKWIESNDELTLETVALKYQQYTIHIINSVDKTKLTRNTSHRRSTVSLGSNLLLCRYMKIIYEHCGEETI